MFWEDSPYEFDTTAAQVSLTGGVDVILPWDNSRSLIVFSRPTVGGGVFVWPFSDVSTTHGVAVPGNAVMEISEKTWDVFITLQWYAVAAIPGTTLSILTARRRMGKKTLKGIGHGESLQSGANSQHHRSAGNLNADRWRKHAEKQADHQFSHEIFRFPRPSSSFKRNRLV